MTSSIFYRRLLYNTNKNPDSHVQDSLEYLMTTHFRLFLRRLLPNPFALLQQYPKSIIALYTLASQSPFKHDRILRASTIRSW